MAITLKKATREDIETIWKMQVEAFTELLDKYGSITKLMGFRIPHIINSAHINEF